MVHYAFARSFEVSRNSSGPEERDPCTLGPRRLSRSWVRAIPLGNARQIWNDSAKPPGKQARVRRGRFLLGCVTDFRQCFNPTPPALWYRCIIAGAVVLARIELKPERRNTKIYQGRCLGAGLVERVLPGPDPDRHCFAFDPVKRQPGDPFASGQI